MSELIKHECSIPFRAAMKLLEESGEIIDL